jgi:microcompartment protein CcmL/EutN
MAAKKKTPGPALAMLQIASVPLGLRALDALVKEAPVEVALRGTVQCGHYLISFAGEVEAVERSFGRALAAAGDCTCDRVLLPDAEPRILPAFREGSVTWPVDGDALGVLQTSWCPSLLAALDLALKGARVELVELRLADGLGGKAIATLWGEIFDVEAAVEQAERGLSRHAEKQGVPTEGAMMTVIPNADDETRAAVSAGTRFFSEWRG